MNHIKSITPHFPPGFRIICTLLINHPIHAECKVQITYFTPSPGMEAGSSSCSYSYNWQWSNGSVRLRVGAGESVMRRSRLTSNQIKLLSYAPHCDTKPQSIATCAGCYYRGIGQRTIYVGMHTQARDKDGEREID